MTWKTQDECEAKHGTQSAQAAKETSNKIEMDGPWRLERWIGDELIPLDNSVRSTSKEVKTLKRREYERTGIVWFVVRYE